MRPGRPAARLDVSLLHADRQRRRPNCKGKAHKVRSLEMVTILVTYRGPSTDATHAR